MEFEKGKDRVVMNVQMASKKRENDVQKSWKEYKWENNRMWGEELKDGGYLGELRGISLGLKVICGVPYFSSSLFFLLVRHLSSPYFYFLCYWGLLKLSSTYVQCIMHNSSLNQSCLCVYT